MPQPSFREAIRDYIRQQAKPRDKFSHQPRLYTLAAEIAGAEGQTCDDDVLYAAAWMHDLGVFVGHRPEDPSALAGWDHVAYVEGAGPRILQTLGFPSSKIPAVVEAIRNHLPAANPPSFEGIVLRDADILEQLGAVGILRTVSKTGRDTRFLLFSDALRALRKNLDELPAKLRLPSARRMAEPRVLVLRGFLAAAEAEAGGIDW